MPLPTDRVRARTAQDILRRIDDTTVSHLAEYSLASPEAVNRRLEALDHEWDTDRSIEAEAATMGLLGLALGTLLRPSLLGLPAVVAGALFAHATTGWYPWLPALRRLGVRSSREIARERYALKALRGDFANMTEPLSTSPGATATAHPGTVPDTPTIPPLAH